jgi:universal stress protein E
MPTIRRILVAVKDTDRGSSAAVRKAAALALALNARLELFHALTEPVAVEMLEVVNENMDTYCARERIRHLKRLERIAARLRRLGVKVSTAVEWDYPAHEALIRRAKNTDAQLVVAQLHARRHVVPWLFRYTDWELLRQCPVPLLLVKRAGRYHKPAVLAAIDPSHAFEKTARLDQQILRAGAEIAAATGGPLHVVHAFTPTVVSMQPVGLHMPETTLRAVERSASNAARGVAQALRTARLGKLANSRRHLEPLQAVVAIPEMARQLSSSIVVMGALSRSGLKGLVVGNTAEQLLDAMPCDVLIVKPAGFVNHTPARKRGPRLVVLTTP